MDLIRVKVKSLSLIKRYSLRRSGVDEGCVSAHS